MRAKMMSDFPDSNPSRGPTPAGLGASGGSNLASSSDRISQMSTPFIEKRASRIPEEDSSESTEYSDSENVF